MEFGVGGFFGEILQKIMEFVKGTGYENLWDRYGGTDGFLLGAAAAFLIYGAGSGEQRKIGFVRTLVIVVVLNSLWVVYGAVGGWMSGHPAGWAEGAGGVDSGMSMVAGMNAGMSAGMNVGMSGGLSTGIDKGLDVFELAVNPLAGAILVLLIALYYKEYMGRAFCLGVITYGLPLLLFNAFDHSAAAWCCFLIARAVLLGFVCMILTKPKYVYTCLILFAVYYLCCRTVQFLLVRFLETDHWWSGGQAGEMLASLAPDVLLWGAFIAVAVIYERAVLPVRRPATV